MSWLSIIVIIVVLIVLYVVAKYNGLLRKKSYVQEAYAQIDVHLKRRNDLIPNLVNVVKGYAKHEQETLAKVVELRNQMQNVQGDVEKTDQLSTELSAQLRTVFALSEAYPDLKANENFLNLQEELTNTENKIAYARQSYNSTVMEYNYSIASFPSNIIANMFNFTKEQMLATPEVEKTVPKVEF